MSGTDLGASGEMGTGTATSTTCEFVMPGLVPGIHVLLKDALII
jgi:hypothetical protein